MDYSMGSEGVSGHKERFIRGILGMERNMEMEYLCFKMEKNIYKEDFIMMYSLAKNLHQIIVQIQKYKKII